MNVIRIIKKQIIYVNNFVLTRKGFIFASLNERARDLIVLYFSF